MKVKEKTRQRLFLERELLPKFAARFPPSAFVVNIAAGDHPYREYFTCRYVTSDKAAGCDEQYPVEAIPYPDGTFDGVVFVNAFDRLDDPMQAVREVWRVLKPGAWLLFGATDLQFEWRVPRDRWRLSPGGLMHVMRAFTVIETHNIDRVVHYVVAQKPSI